MANLEQNPIWDQVASASDSVSESLMGPNYSYADNVKGPAALGVGPRGTIGQLVTNAGAMFQYLKYMISGPALGNAYFVNTGGSCMAPDKTVQSRYNYINNVSSGADVLPQAMKRDLGGIASDFNGLIPGILEDTEGLNPVHLFTSLAADSTPACECYACLTSGGIQYRFLTKELTADFNPATCVLSESSKCIDTKEEFTNRSELAYPALILIGILAILIATK
jgi:hypothetical protein